MFLLNEIIASLAFSFLLISFNLVLPLQSVWRFLTCVGQWLACNIRFEPAFVLTTYSTLQKGTGEILWAGLFY